MQTRYARTTDGAYLGYQVAGDGPVDLVWQPDWPGNIDMEWEFRLVRGFLDGFASFSRLILHDHRGVGLSSRNVTIPNLETRVADLLAVLDAVQAWRPSLVGWGSSAAVHALLASTRPERVAAMVWMDATPRTRWAPDYPWRRAGGPPTLGHAAVVGDSVRLPTRFPFWSTGKFPVAETGVWVVVLFEADGFFDPPFTHSTGRSSSLPRSRTGAGSPGQARCSSSRARRGRTPTWSPSTQGSRRAVEHERVLHAA